MVHTVAATFKFKDEQELCNFKKVMVSENGLMKTRCFEGCVSIECYDAGDNTVVIWQKWDSKNCHAEYFKMRTEEGLLDKIKESLREPLEVIHLKNISV
jgi:quinol monooxygenase YgiN